jgi:ABC-type glycerol-3-phosphate transport system substrate-binding protein
VAQSSSNFKIILIGVFAVVAVGGFLVFAGLINIGSSSSSTTVEGTATVWGTIDDRAMHTFIDPYNEKNPKQNVVYVQKSTDTFAEQLIDAIASGTAPDLVILSDNLLWRLQDKLTLVPYTSLPQRTYQDTFISAANIFAGPSGIYAIPWAADPLVMYYNRDLLEAAGYPKAPSTWQGFVESVAKITKKKPDQSIVQSGTALGTYRNVVNAKNILAFLFIQSGSPFITAGNNGTVLPRFGSTGSAGEASAAAQALAFYLSFADPAKDIYTWNTGLGVDRDAFIASRVGYYFGLGSELLYIRAANPNLNFDIVLPPAQDSTRVITTGRLYGFAIPKSASNSLLSYTIASALVSAEQEQNLSDKAGGTLGLVPVRRDVLANKPTKDSYGALLYMGTLVMRAWIDPAPSLSDSVFAKVVTDVTSGVQTIDSALTRAASELTSGSR